MSRGDRLLSISGFILMILGIIGVLLPLLPGPLLSILGLLLIHRTSAYHIPRTRLIIFVVLVIITTVVDYILPLRGTKKYGGTKEGVTGSTLGLLAGLFVFPPFGMIVGPFVGAFVGEYIAHHDKKKALRSARGSFVGFLLTTGLKLFVAGRILVYALTTVF